MNNIIHTFFNPKSVVVIGASKNPMKGGHHIVRNLTQNNFKGKVYLVNPNAEGELFGLKFEKSVLDIKGPVDIAIFYVGNTLIPGLLKECVQKGIKGAIIESSGFEEVGKHGLELKDEIIKITENFSKIRIVGPNCLGLSRIDGDSDSKGDEKGGLFTGFAFFSNYKRGNIAIISQSGTLNGGYLGHQMEAYPNTGFRYSCAIGNKMDLDETYFLEYMLNDPTVNVVAMYLESFKNPRKFIELCKRTRTMKNKTIILAKGGLTTQGQNATQSHTGSLAENSLLIDAIIKQSGVIKAHSFHELFQFARTFSMMYETEKSLPKNGNLCTITGSGGFGTVIADLTNLHGLSFPNLGDLAYKALEEIYPTWMPPNRFALLDIWPAIEKGVSKKLTGGEVIKSCFDIVAKEPNIEGIFINMFCAKGGMWSIDKIIEDSTTTSKPIFINLIGDSREIKRVSGKLSKNKIPNFMNLEEMVKNFSILFEESKNKSKEY
jgi:acyl-CoA synthetase (NDP forming)